MDIPRVLTLLVFWVVVAVTTGVAQDAGEFGGEQRGNSSKSHEKNADGIISVSAAGGGGPPNMEAGRKNQKDYNGIGRRNFQRVIASLRGLCIASNARRGRRGRAVVQECTDSVQNNAISDIYVTPEQADDLLYRALGRERARKKRKVAYTTYWALPIKYVFEHLAYSTAEKNAIRAGIAHWESNTCLEFVEYTSENWLAGKYLKFQRSGGCSSYIGSHLTAQKISIDTGCFDVGTVTHELGHALAFWHEQSRADRDQYVTVQFDNINPGKIHNFEQADTKMNVRYDLGSNMHYNSRAFPVSGLADTEFTIIAKEPRYQYAMSWQSALSFADIKAANIQYCGLICESYSTTCYNEGYPDPKNCSSCRCPEGLTGDCSKVEPSTHNCHAEISVTTTPIIITSPNYPNIYEGGTKCQWLLRPSTVGGKVVVSIGPEYGFQLWTYYACRDYLEIRYQGIAFTGSRFCGMEYDTLKLTSGSVGEPALVLFRGWAGGAKGFSLTTYEDIDVCIATSPCGVGTCTTEGGPSYNCTCPSGYYFNGTTCVEHTNCTYIPCGVGVCASSINDTYSCACPVGYSAPATGGSCEDDDECQANPTVCDGNATCTNTPGSFFCTCNEGFTGYGRLFCDDIDECAAVPGYCSENATCTNSVGSYDCECSAGFSGNGLYCVDLDECEEGQHSCHQYAQCTNTYGSYFCTCASGFDGDGATNCTDRDECALELYTCGDHAECFNTIGSYTCRCQHNFTGDGFTCTNVCAGNPCNEGTCYPNVHLYSCICPLGQYFNGTTCTNHTDASGKTGKIATSIVCGDTEVTIQYAESSDTFSPPNNEGIVYVDKHYSQAGCYVQQPPWVLTVPYGQCGVVQDQEFTVILQHDKDYYLETIDEAQPFTCKRQPYDTTIHNITNIMAEVIVLLEFDQPVKYEGVGSFAIMRLFRSKDNSSILPNGPPVVLGENITMQLILGKIGEREMKIKVERCWANGITDTNEWKTLELLSGGCPVVPFFNGFSRGSSQYVAISTFPMFRITPRNPANGTMGFFCSVAACMEGNMNPECVESQCPGNKPGWGKRKRRDKPRDNYVTTVNQNGVDVMSFGYYFKVVDSENDGQMKVHMGSNYVPQIISTTDTTITTTTTTATTNNPVLTTNATTSIDVKKTNTNLFVAFSVVSGLLCVLFGSFLLCGGVILCKSMFSN
ncbi:uncharacterized protein LOC106181263 [Lingula anatina]|uniref:Metalloendopeptidase n=1 Tax=Lingula anatina TaxID=7574 RepID=A0A1S3KFN6_LINAN|nr:uncharacterized protein LOC106181263 [Lingula anatina]|eukprot:XP_013421046.1 uncharacterized protein LOC106181263 [Lingula anatina]